MSEENIMVNLATTIRKAAHDVADKVVRKIVLVGSLGEEDGVGMLIHGDPKFYIPTQQAELFKDGTINPKAPDKNMSAEVLMGVVKEVVIAAVGDAVAQLYGDIANLNQQAFLDEFHKFCYENPGSYSVTWMGCPIQKNAFDMILLQEIIYRTKPDVIIETGTANGGSALFMAQLLDILGEGVVVSIDIESGIRPVHPRIMYIQGSSDERETYFKARMIAEQGKRVMVVLDSDHSMEHVYAEMVLYGMAVTDGCYMIVEDTNINGKPVRPDFGPGPTEAIEKYLSEFPYGIGQSKFVQDRDVEHFPFTYHPGGYLRKVKGE
jgi:cephalosporin hydroxylase